jgi:hypothetical protein
MPDRRRHRGPHPQDRSLFADSRLAALRAAVADYSWLLGKGYAEDSALRLVGDRFQLAKRQRLAVRRCACSEAARDSRRARQMDLEQCPGKILEVDGFNLLITIESALSGGLVLVGRDRCVRDLASVWGTYRTIDETRAAVALIVDFLTSAGVRQVAWYLDRPVSNSGRLKSLIGEVLEADNQWRIELVESPDSVLAAARNPVVTSDSGILDRCSGWVNLAAQMVEERIAGAWRVDLSG